MGNFKTATKSFLNSLLDREMPNSSNQVNGLASIGNNSMIFKSIYSNAFESLNQEFYTRLAQSVDPIDSAITFYCELLASGKLKSIDKNGKEVTDTDLLIKLLQNPNENQNFAQFIKENLYYTLSHGWSYIVPQSSAIGFEKSLKQNIKNSIYNVDPDHVKFLNQNWIQSIFNKKEVRFQYKPLGFNEVYFTDVINFIDVRQNSQKPHIGVSRLLALKQQIENWSIAGQAKENMIKRTGSALVSLDGKVEDLALDGTTFERDNQNNVSATTHKDKLNKELQETGLGNGNSVMFSTLPLKVTPLSAGIDSIPFDKMMVEDARQIYNKFNVPKEFQNLTTESAKFMNRQMAMIEVIQNTIEPLARSFCDKIQSFYNWENTISIDFSHLPVFAENQNTKITTQQAIITMYEGLFEKLRITEQELIQIYRENGITK